MGQLSVVTVMAGYAVAELTDGDYSKVEKGAVVKRLTSTSSSGNAQADKEVRPTAGSSEAPIQW